MASDMRHAGIGWPENAGGEHPSRDYILGMPGMQGAVTICSPSARYHYDYIRRGAPNATVVWRAIPRRGLLPAELGWDANRVADECLNLWNEQPHTTNSPEWFLPLNELQFAFENGGPFPGYGVMAENLGKLRLQLRRKFSQKYPDLDVRLMFPAWVPQDDGDRLDEWATEAQQWSGIALHCYGSADTMRERYRSYRDAFPTLPIFVGEWNSNHEGHDELRSLVMWGEVAAHDPLFLGATYYIWETSNTGEQDLSIWGNPDREELFRNPPLAPLVESEPEEPPMKYHEFPAKGVDVASYQGNPDWVAVAASGITFAFTKLSEDNGYINPYFERNWVAIKAAGLYRGVYHFARPQGQDAETEARYFLDNLFTHGGALDYGDMIVLDIEAGAGDLGHWVLKWLQYVENYVGFKPLVYTGAWFAGPHNFAAVPELAEYGLWIAAYQDEMPFAFAPWLNVAFWQYTSKGQVPGIGGDVDMNVFNGDVNHIPMYGLRPSEEPPVSEYNVGPGILAKMQEFGDSPATNEMYTGEIYSEAYGQTGARYVYIKSLNRTFRYNADA